ncbi:MAG: EcsC family protein [Defluviitaleaceae bacterium]|nr:EcsC family protein [Defluviitaleaceae bacterium]
MSKIDAMNVLDILYDKALSGVPFVSESVDDLAKNYMEKYPNHKKAVNKLIENQIIKCGTSGFITGLGGMITLPIAIPANLTSVLYVQLRMIACIAYIGGHKPTDDEVKTLAYACLSGVACADILKRSGIKVGEKITTNFIKKIPGAVLIEINKKFGFRFITKFGQKGVVNLWRVVPVIGGVIGGGMDIVSTQLTARNAKRVFIRGKI